MPSRKMTKHSAAEGLHCEGSGMRWGGKWCKLKREFEHLINFLSSITPKFLSLRKNKTSNPEGKKKKDEEIVTGLCQRFTNSSTFSPSLKWLFWNLHFFLINVYSLWSLPFDLSITILGRNVFFQGTEIISLLILKPAVTCLHLIPSTAAKARQAGSSASPFVPWLCSEPGLRIASPPCATRASWLTQLEQIWGSF